MQTSSLRPVFIIGGSRTGSTMLQTILSKSLDINVTDELQFRTPWYLHRDFETDIEKYVAPLDDQGAIDRLMDLFYSGVPTGWFWSASERLLDRELVRDELSKQPLTTKSIFDAILTAHAKRQGKSRIGAKFPMHYSYANQLLEWYPDCLLIHTTRNPKAVYASQGAKYLKSNDSWLSRSFMRFRQFVHINIQTTWTAYVHKKLRALPNYCLIRYEDLVADPEQNIRQLCAYLDTEFQPEMLAPKQFGSSFKGRGEYGEGIAQSSVERWRSSISPITATAIDLAHPFALKALGYSKK